MTGTGAQQLMQKKVQGTSRKGLPVLIPQSTSDGSTDFQHWQYVLKIRQQVDCT